MGKVYAPPKEVGESPTINAGFDYSTYTKDCDKYVKRIMAYAKAEGKGEYTGEKISFGVADGQALYVVLSLAPVKLIHVPIGDKYQFPYVNRLTAADIKKLVQKQHTWARMFS